MANCKKNSSLVKISTFFTFHNFLLTHLKSFCSHQNCSCGRTDNLYFVKATVNFRFTSYTNRVAFEISLRTLLAPPTLHPTILCLAHSVILWTWHAYSCLRVRVFAGHWAWGALPAVLRRAYSSLHQVFPCPLLLASPGPYWPSSRVLSHFASAALYSILRAVHSSSRCLLHYTVGSMRAGNVSDSLTAEFLEPRTVPGTSVQFSSVAQSCPTLCDSMNLSRPGLPLHHKLLEFTQTHVHQVGDVIQPSHPLSSPSPSAHNPSQHQGLFQWVSPSHEVAKVWEFQLQHQSFQWTPRTDLL